MYYNEITGTLVGDTYVKQAIKHKKRNERLCKI